MKSVAVTAAILLTATFVYAQGSIVFRNSSSTVVTLGGAPVPVGTTFSINLYYHEDATTAPDHDMFSALGNPVNFPVPGRFTGGIRITPDTTQPAEAAWFQVRAWETAFGLSYEAAVLAGATRVGISSKFKLVVGAPTGTPTLLASPGGFTGLDIVPEPSALTLSLVGLTVLLVLRRLPKKNDRSSGVFGFRLF